MSSPALREGAQNFARSVESSARDSGIFSGLKRTNTRSSTSSSSGDSAIAGGKATPSSGGRARVGGGVLSSRNSSDSNKGSFMPYVFHVLLNRSFSLLPLRFGFQCQLVHQMAIAVLQHFNIIQPWRICSKTAHAKRSRKGTEDAVRTQSPSRTYAILINLNTRPGGGR